MREVKTMFYVYEWYIKNTDEIIYVGKGCKRRYKVKKHNSIFNEMLKQYECDSRIVKTFNLEKDAFDYEHTRVNELREKGQCICNIYDGGFGGTSDDWSDEKRELYSKKNVMKRPEQRNRMKYANPMSNKEIAEKTNGQKRRKVTVGNTTYNSIKEAKEVLGVSYSNLITWGRKGMTPNGECIKIEPQKQHWNRYARQSATKLNETNKSNLEGSTTNE